MPLGLSLLSPRTVTDKLALALAGVASIGLACISYGVFVERTWYRRRVYRLEILPPQARPLTILHLSDLHFLAKDDAKARFMASLGEPEVVVLTGDIIGEPAGVERAVEALRAVRGKQASYFVLGSNDYFAPQPLNYFTYFRGPHKRRISRRNRTADLVSQLERDGWVHLKNRKTEFARAGLRFEVVGMDDPHIGRHDLRVALRNDADAIGLALVHSPDPAPELAALGYPLILSGHTHGGQVRLPFVGALVTNSQIPNRLAMGLSRLGPSLLHVSPGLGTSKFAPFRFLCRPEATVLELVPARSEVAENGQRSATGAAAAATARSNTRS